MSDLGSLRAPQSDDDLWLAGAIGTWWITARWAIDGARGPEAIDHLLWQGVERQAVAIGPSGRPDGLLQLTSVDLRNGHAAIDLVVRPDARSEGRASALVRDFAFRSFLSLPLRKLYLSFLEPPSARRTTFDHGAAVEGRLVGHVGGGGERRDLVISSFTRQELATVAGSASGAPR